MSNALHKKAIKTNAAFWTLYTSVVFCAVKHLIHSDQLVPLKNTAVRQMKIIRHWEFLYLEFHFAYWITNNRHWYITVRVIYNIQQYTTIPEIYSHLPVRRGSREHGAPAERCARGLAEKKKVFQRLLKGRPLKQSNAWLPHTAQSPLSNNLNCPFNIEYLSSAIHSLQLLHHLLAMGLLSAWALVLKDRFDMVITKSFTCYLPSTLQAVGASWGSSLMMCPWKQGKGVTCLITQHRKSLLLDFAEILQWCQNISKSDRSTFSCWFFLFYFIFIFFLISALKKASDVILQTAAFDSLSDCFCVIPLFTAQEALSISRKRKKSSSWHSLVRKHLTTKSKYKQPRLLALEMIQSQPTWGSSINYHWLWTERQCRWE